jgi:ComF family protein
LGKLLARAYPREQSFDVIVPVPMHWRRRWQRGFNQAELLAQALSRRIRAPLGSPAKRSRPTPALAGMTRAARRQKVTGVFGVHRPADVKGKKVLVIDDVLTTGATAGALARALKRSGARYVAILTVARADRRPAQAIEVVATGDWGKPLDAEFGSIA